MEDNIRELIEPFLPADSAAQVDAMAEIPRVKAILGDRPAIRILDLGAGAGDSIKPLTRAWPESEWLGLDIESSPEVDMRDRDDPRFRTYDGRRMPFADDSFDVIYSRQVLEHVRYPDEVIAEVARILKPGGVFFGSVSQLEPYHSFSIFNWTLYGIIEVFSGHGLHVRELRPGIDGLTLILRRLLGRSYFRRMFGKHEGILNHFISGSERRVAPEDVRSANFKKLLVAGHVIFIAQNREP